MEWLQFEHEVRQLVEAFGYQAETTTPSHDFGVDVIAKNQRHHIVIQCKLYGKGRIGGDTMMKLVGSRHYFGATDAICITTSQFTRQAKEIAARQDIKLIDREKLILLCRDRKLTIPSLTVLLTDSEDLFALSALEMTVGREPDNHIVLSDPLVSRRHAALTRKELNLTVTDCGSTNGTSVNGEKIAAPTRLNYYDEIVIGGTMLVVAMQTPTGIVKFSAR